MPVSSVLLGLGFVVVGPLYYRLVMAWSNSDRQVRRLTEGRWGIGRYVDRRARRGEISKEEWIDESIPRVRKEMRGWLLPMSVFLTGFGIFLIASALIS